MEGHSHTGMWSAPGQGADSAAPDRTGTNPEGWDSGQTRRAEPGFLRASVGHSHQEQDTEPWSCLPGAEPGRVVESSIIHWLQPKSVLQRRVMSVLHRDVRGKGKWELQFRFPGHCHMSPGGGQEASVVWTLPRRQGQSPGQAGHCESHPWGQSQRLPALS